MALLLLAVLVLLSLPAAQVGGEEPQGHEAKDAVLQGQGLRGFFRDTGAGLEYAGEGWTIRSDGERGWVSLKAGTSEFFLQADRNGSKAGAVAFKKGDAWFTGFPDRSNIAHDEQIGRIGSVSDGINMVRIAPERHRPEFELYLGANEKQDQQVCVFLGEQVAFVRTGFQVGSHRTGPNRVIGRGEKVPASMREALVVHRDGVALVVSSEAKGAKGEEPPEFQVGRVKGPDGKEAFALIFPCKGFVANSYRLAVDVTPQAENFVTRPSFDVKSSDDPPGHFGGPLMGVQNPIYGPNTKLDFGIQFEWLGGDARPFKGYAELEVIHSLGQKHFYQKVDLAGATPVQQGKASIVRAKFEPKFHLPGVSEVWGRLADENGRLIWVGRYRMAYDWEHYKPSFQVEPDFKAFWKATLEELRKAPLEPVTERVKQYADHPKFEIYDVTFNSWGGKRVHAMMFVPKGAAQPLPVLITAHPGTRGFGINKGADGVYGSELRQDPRFVTIVPLIRGHAPDDTDVPFNHPWWGPLGDRDTYVARSWYCAMVRSIDYLATRPDLADMKRIISAGGSQGGALALVTAALDPRVAVCVADCPANCQPQEIMNHYSSFGPSKGQVPAGQTPEQVARMLSYYNPVNFCPMIGCPTYVGSNIGDLTVHSMGPLAAYHNLTGLKPEDKAFYPGFTHFHGSGPGLGVKKNEWMERLGGPKPTTSRRAAAKK